MAVETLAYEVKKRDGDFEIRWYPNYQIIENENSDGFDELFRYISGTNQEGTKIAMTAPVLNKLDAHGMRSMSFVIPASIKAPQPIERGLALKSGAAGQFAVVRFSGSVNERTVEKELHALRLWLDKQGLSYGQEVYVARFNPPFMPPIFRHNEIMIALL